MAKRFTDSALWERDWYLGLSPVEKAAWHYITDNCDAVGVWPCAFKKAEFCIGAPVDWKAFRDKCNGNIAELDSGKWFLVDFCEFQYGKLDEACKPHKSYLSLLRKHGLEGYTKGIHTLKEKEKEKEIEKEPEKEKEKDPLYQMVWKAMLSKNDGLFAKWKQEGQNCKEVVKLARAREKAVPGVPASELLQAMLSKFWALKQSDKFYSQQPFTPSMLLSLWSRILETMRRDEVPDEVKAIIAGGA